jgi:PncC family amidohydrolase
MADLYLPDPTDEPTVMELRKEAHLSAVDLLRKLAHVNTTRGEKLQIATAESLTGGKIMSTLVDIPMGGMFKYGAFVVYDTDAKRLFLGVEAPDVYTRLAAGQMAVGVLRNSNAALAIAVSGNSMPSNEHSSRLGEVFIGVAGYHKNEIVFKTKTVNACIDASNPEMKRLCKKWFQTINPNPNGVYNRYQDTAAVSLEIRYTIAKLSYDMMNQFIDEVNPTAPAFLASRKRILSREPTDCGDGCMPLPNKYAEGGDGICLDEECDTLGDRSRFTKEITDVKLLDPVRRTSKRSRKKNRSKRASFFR